MRDAPHQRVLHSGESDREAQLRDPVHFLGQKLHGPVRQKLLPRDDLRVKQLSILVSIAEVITRIVLIREFCLCRTL